MIDTEKNYDEITEDGVLINNEFYELVDINAFNNEEFNKSNNFLHSFYKDLDITEQKIVNRLVYIFSSSSTINKNNSKKLEHYRNIIQKQGYWLISHQQLLELIDKIRISGKITTNKKTDLTIDETQKHLSNIRNTEMIYQICTTDADTGLRQLEESHTSFLVHYKSIVRQDGSKYYKLYVDRNLYNDLFSNPEKIGYSVYNIKNLMKIRSKIAFGLFDEIYRFKNLKKLKDGKPVRNAFKEKEEYSLKKLNEMFGTKFKYMSKIKEKINIQYNKLVMQGILEDFITLEFDREKMTMRRKV